MEENWVNIQDQAGEWTKIVAGKDENDLEVARSFVVGCDQQGATCKSYLTQRNQRVFPM